MSKFEKFALVTTFVLVALMFLSMAAAWVKAYQAKQSTDPENK